MLHERGQKKHYNNNSERWGKCWPMNWWVNVRWCLNTADEKYIFWYGKKLSSKYCISVFLLHVIWCFRLETATWHAEVFGTKGIQHNICSLFSLVAKFKYISVSLTHWRSRFMQRPGTVHRCSESTFPSSSLLLCITLRSGSSSIFLLFSCMNTRKQNK